MIAARGEEEELSVLCGTFVDWRDSWNGRPVAAAVFGENWSLANGGQYFVALAVFLAPSLAGSHNTVPN